jgi:hypothetical protein
MFDDDLVKATYFSLLSQLGNRSIPRKQRRELWRIAQNTVLTGLHARITSA